MGHTDKWSLEGGVEDARLILRGFDRTSGTWSFETSGRFWESVSIAHEVGRRGEGKRIAIVDDGFDLTYPQLQSRTIRGPQFAGPFFHGTLVALLIHHVAPEAELVLYPVGPPSSGREAFIAGALKDIAASKTFDIVNISIARLYPKSKAFNQDQWASGLPRWPGATPRDLRAIMYQALSHLPSGQRDLIDAPDSQVGGLATQLASDGTIVMAAAGNEVDSLGDPAIRRGVFSAGFRTQPGQGITAPPETPYWIPPQMYKQSDWVDFGIYQPRGVLGSSNAAPLMTGLVALMQDPRQLADFERATFLATLGTTLNDELRPDTVAAVKRREPVVSDLFARAMRALPHRHRGEPTVRCAECYLLAEGVIVNYARFLLYLGDVVGAEECLLEALAINPSEAVVSANLGHTYMLRAANARGAFRARSVRSNLQRAAAYMRTATRLNPNVQQWRTSLADFERGVASPKVWRPNSAQVFH